MAMDAPTTWSPAARLGLQDSAWIAVPLHVGGEAVAGGASEASAAWQAVGRTPGDLIVVLPVGSQVEAEELRGQVRSLRVSGSQALLLRGELVQ